MALTKQNLLDKIQEAKDDVKFWECTELIVDAFLNKERYEYSLYNGVLNVELFRHNQLFFLGELYLKSKDFNHYSDMTRDCMSDDRKLEVRRLKAAVKFYEEKHEGNDRWKIVREITNEKLEDK